MDKVLQLLILAPAFVSALTIHEFAHAWAAYKLGDDTAQRQGRLTLDPLAHLDPLGTLLIVIAILTGAPLIGWAKPVPFQMRNLNNPRRDAMLVAVAGPISNILQAIVWLFILFIFRLAIQQFGMNIDESSPFSSLPSLFMTMTILSVSMNITLAVFNMIPLPPLDGHYVLEGLGPPFIADFFDMIRPYAFIILLGLLWTGVFSQVLGPFMDFADRLIEFVLTVPIGF